MIATIWWMIFVNDTETKYHHLEDFEHMLHSVWYNAEYNHPYHYIFWYGEELQRLSNVQVRVVLFTALVPVHA